MAQDAPYSAGRKDGQHLESGSHPSAALSMFDFIMRTLTFLHWRSRWARSHSWSAATGAAAERPWPAPPRGGQHPSRTVALAQPDLHHVHRVCMLLHKALNWSHDCLPAHLRPADDCRRGRCMQRGAHPPEVHKSLLAAAGHPAPCQGEVQGQQHGVHGQVGQHMVAPQLEREPPCWRISAGPPTPCKQMTQDSPHSITEG